MLFDNRIWQALNIAAILLSAFGALYSGLFVPGASTEKQLISSRPDTAELVHGLSTLQDIIKLSILIDNQPMKNLVLSNTRITNAGSVPINKSDIDIPLSIHVDEPWKILAVVNAARDAWTTDHPTWTKVTDQDFQASNELLNPGDSIKAIVFITNPQYDYLPTQQLERLKPVWSAHILNLRSIVEETSPGDKLERDPLGIFPLVALYGSGLIATLLSAGVFMVVYLYLLYELDYLKQGTWHSVAAILGITFVSLAASEAMATYFFPRSL
jgi:hypothetical protein